LSALAAVVAAAVVLALPGGGSARVLVVPDHLTVVLISNGVTFAKPLKKPKKGRPRPRTPTVPGGSTFTVKIYARDASDHPLKSYNGSATWSDLSGNLSPSGPHPLSNGVSTTTGVTITGAFKNDKITASSGGANGDSKIFNVLGPLAEIRVSVTEPVSAGANFSAKASAWDAAGNQLTAYSGAANWSDLSGNLTGAPSTFSNGLSSTSSAQVSGPFHQDKLSVQSGAVTGQSAGFNVLGPIDHLVVTAPSAVLVGTPFGVKAQAYDSANNQLPAYAGAGTWSDLTGTLAPATPAAFSGGLSKTTNATVSTTGSGDQITISTGGASGTSAPFDVTGPPVANPDTFAGVPGVSLDLPVSGPGGPAANDTDPDGDTLTVSVVSSAVGGTVSISGGMIHFVGSGPCGAGAGGFNYKVSDSHGNSAASTVTINLDCRPTADDQSVSTNEGTGVLITLTGSDADGDSLTFAKTSGPSHGSLSAIGSPSCAGTPSNCSATATYTPDTNYNGPDSFDFKTNDGLADSAKDGTVSITVNAVDTPPTAVDDSATVLEDSGANTIDVLANDTDVDGGPKTIQSKTDGTHGTVAITNSGADLTYTPAANFCGSDSFTYTLNGGSTATVNVTVTCVNDAPSFTKGADQTNVANQNSDGTAKAFTISGWATGISPGPSDEAGQTVDFVIDSVNPSNLFTVQPAVTANGDLSFTTDPAHTGTATVTLHIHDNGGTANGGVDASATQSFTIQTVQPPPVAVDDAYTATGNVAINVSTAAEGVLQRGTDDSLFSATLTNCGSTNATSVAASGGSCTTASSGGGSATLTTADGTFTYNPPSGFTGSDTFFYRLTNSGGTSTGKVTVTVSDMIWFFDASNASAGDGRLSNPFKAISSFVNDGTAGHGKDGQTLFIAAGTYSTGLTLRASQILIGQGAGASITTISGITLAPFSATLPSTGGTRPSLTTSSGSAITLGSGNTIRGLNVDNTAVSDIVGSGFGTLTLSEVTLAGTGQALDLTNGTANATFGSVSSTSGTNGIKLSSVAGSLDFGSGGALSGSSGDEFLVSAGTNGYTYPGTITKSGSGNAVNVSSHTGGTITFSGAISDSGGSDSGISLTSNTGATFSFTGGVSLSTGNNNAFVATGGGTVSVDNTGVTNTLTTTGGLALKVQNTTIGSPGLKFKSISAGTSSGTAGDGIFLDTTGSTAGLTVTGDGSFNRNGTGGTIQHKTGSDSSTTSGIGIYLNSTSSVELDSMNLHDFDNFAVFGNGVNGFTLKGAQISGVNGTTKNPVPAAEGDLIFDSGSGAALTGTVTISGSDIQGGFGRDIDIRNQSGTLTLNVLNNPNISNPDFTNSQDDMLLEADGTSTMTATIKGNSFVNHQSGVVANSGAPDCIQAISNDSATMNITIGGATAAEGNTFDTAFVLLNLDLNSSNQYTYLVQHNTFQYISGGYSSSRAINLFTGSGSTGKMTGSILNNTITHDSTAAASFALSASPTGNGAFVGNFNNNNITWPSKGLIDAVAGNGSNSSATMDVNIKNNTLNFTNLAAAADHTVTIGAGTNTGDTNSVCADIASNTFEKSGGGSGQEIRLVETVAGVHMRLPGYTGAATSSTDIGTYMRGTQANVESPANASLPSAGGTFGVSPGLTTPGGAACSTS
jgi:large repetitive protein